MRVCSVGFRSAVFGISLLAAFSASPTHALASTSHARKVTKPLVHHNLPLVHTPLHSSAKHVVVGGKTLRIVHVMAHGRQFTAHHLLLKGGKARYSGYSAYHGGGGLQCVTFARAASGIELKGNAVNWWDAAAGVYARGQAPEPGSVLNFRANGHMRLGHVAVVTQLVNSREIVIDHANWAGPGASKGGVSRAISVVDVSERNDWTAVRVALGHSGEYGSVYPTYGFIYDRPDNGMMATNSRADISHADEVAEAPTRTLR